MRCAFALKAVLKTALRLPPSRSGDWNMSTDELDCIVSLCFVEAHRTAQAVFRDMMAATLAAGERSPEPSPLALAGRCLPSADR